MSEKSNKARLDKNMNALSKQSHKQQPKPNSAAGSKPTKYKRTKKNQPAQNQPSYHQTGSRQKSHRQKQRKAPKAQPLRI